ncbi:MAG: LPS export ABC transporter periplasmic protein LptC [Chlorobi bacterium]|nr:LPS export ABC transporter periplasmic protein LptC [Chlorobiota bacterium]
MLKLRHLLIFSLLTVMLVSCENDMAEIRAFTNPKKLPDITVKNLKSQYSVNGQMQTVLTTPLAIRYTNPQKDYTIFPKGLTLVFYDKNMNIHSSLRADKGIYYEKKKFAKASGNVILTNVKGSILRTEELFLDEKEEKIYSVKPVNIVDKSGFEITGKGGFESNMDFTVYKFTDVSGKIIKEDDSDFLEGNEDEATLRKENTENKKTKPAKHRPEQLR